MDRSEWRTKSRIQTYFGLFVEVVRVIGVLSVRTNLDGPCVVILISVASATVRVYPPVVIGASILSVAPSASQNATALGIDFINLMAKYQNAWINTGIASTSLLFQNQYTLVCIAAFSALWSVNDNATSVELLAHQRC